MIGRNKDRQLFESRVGRTIFGKDLLNELSRLVHAIEAGQILCFQGPTLTYMFQVLTTMRLDDIKDKTLIGYEPGSVIYRSLLEPAKLIPAFTFDRIYIPDDADLIYYSSRKTV